MSNNVLEVLCKSLIQPNPRPPFWTNKISKPLVRKFVGYNLSYTLLLTSCGNTVLIKESGLSEMKSFD